MHLARAGGACPLPPQGHDRLSDFDHRLNDVSCGVSRCHGETLEQSPGCPPLLAIQQTAFAPAEGNPTRGMPRGSDASRLDRPNDRQRHLKRLPGAIGVIDGWILAIMDLRHALDAEGWQRPSG